MHILNKIQKYLINNHNNLINLVKTHIINMVIKANKDKRFKKL